MNQLSLENPRILYLLRHAKSAWNNSNLTDFDRPLNERGKKNLPGLAQVACLLNPPPDLILTSPSRRTLDTLQGFCYGLSTRTVIQERKELYHASKQDLLSLLHKMPDEIRTILIVGHNPGLKDFMSWIVMGSNCSDHFKMTTGSFVQLALGISSWAKVASQTASLQIIIPGRFSSKLTN
jgi:phosphohistidine phosphatase